ncbi:hypothetical protein QJS04_geneDACA004216 [Acorus gramineus]|uniref:RCC1-like domain-containing protein n=1 Tax=Acorus gramineus TaxID=55184 RepID=A0AAV9B4I9_ACOGR|nr:hypothetical protein QJS04_geneDACA004216 [Acorus gramineus]
MKEESDFPFVFNADIVLNVLNRNLDPRDLANLEATCTFFKNPTNLLPGPDSPITETAALNMCHARPIFQQATPHERAEIKRWCGGSWKLALRFLLAGEAARGRARAPQVLAGADHSVAVASRGAVYSFGANHKGQLGHGAFENEHAPREVEALRGVRVVQAAVGKDSTLLVSEAGRVYACGRKSFGYGGVEGGSEGVAVPQMVEALRDVFVVEAAIGKFFAAVLSVEGKVYTFCWGKDGRVGHGSDVGDETPRLLVGGGIEDLPVVQISAGNCYLLALVFQPSGMSVYSVGCGLGGKLGIGTVKNHYHPQKIEHFQTLNLQPVSISAGAWHAAVLGLDGRVCTWGWGNTGCLGHGNKDNMMVPTVIEGLEHVKVVHVIAGVFTTFLVTEDGDVYSFGIRIYSPGPEGQV